MKKLYIAGALALAGFGATATGCSDVQMAHLAALGTQGRVSCFSGGKMIFDDYSTGKIANAEHSDGYEFNSVSTHRLMQASGTCVVDYGAAPSTVWHATLPGAPEAAPTSITVVPVD